MKICFFQHDPLESPGFILDWAKERGHKSCFVNFHENPAMPEINEIDALIIMGGPMNVGDETDEYAWLELESDFIKQFIKSGKHTFGICLGSQMVADAMGSKVYRNQHTEIGWHKVIVDQAMIPDRFSGIFPDEFMTFHWHGFTFDIPRVCNGFIRSEATRNQAFIHGNVAAFQFHPEITKEGILKLVEHHEEIFKQSYPYIKSRNQMVESDDHFEINKSLLFKFLDRFFEQ